MISGNYRKLTTPEEIEEAFQLYGDAWKDPDLPKIQYETAVKNEIERYRKGAACAPFSAFVKALLSLPTTLDNRFTKLLDIAASSGYYREVLEIAGFKYDYTALDFSEHFKTFAEKIYPGINFMVGDAAKLPIPDNSYDIVVSGCCIIHMKNHEDAITEAARVSKRYVLMHRTPIRHNNKTTYYVKDAYDRPCVEVHYNFQELMNFFLKHNLFSIHYGVLFYNKEEDYGQVEILLEKR